VIPVHLSEACDLLRYGSKAVQLGEAIVDNDPNARVEVGKICAKLPGPLAVRSSAIGEDSEDASFGRAACDITQC
jgi:hypothetical protein